MVTFDIQFWLKKKGLQGNSSQTGIILDTYRINMPFTANCQLMSAVISKLYRSVLALVGGAASDE